MNKINASKKKYFSGYSLIEVLVALALSGMLLAGISKIFIASDKLSKRSQAYTELQESGRVGLQLMSRDIRNAGFWGCAQTDNGQLNKLNMLDTTDADYHPGMDFTDLFKTVEGLNNTIGSILGTTLIPKPGSDYIILRGATPLTAFKLTKAPKDTVADNSIEIMQGASIERGQRLMLTNCKAMAFFTNTAKNVQDTGIIEFKKKNLSNDGAVNNIQDGMDVEFDIDSQLVEPYTKQYLISKSQSINEDGSIGYSLYLIRDYGEPQELVRNVVDMQIEYGVGTNGSVTERLSADEISSWESVISVYITLSTESTSTFHKTTVESASEFNDPNRQRASFVDKKPLTRTYTTAVKIRNR